MHIFCEYHVERRAFTLNIIKSKSELLLGCICGKFTFLFFFAKVDKGAEMQKPKEIASIKLNYPGLARK